jgi:hypothetical protein
VCVCCAVCACALCVCVVCTCAVRRARVCCVCGRVCGSSVVCVVCVVGVHRVRVHAHMSAVDLDLDRYDLRYHEEATRTCGERRHNSAALEGRGPLDRRRPRLTTGDGRRT